MKGSLGFRILITRRRIPRGHPPLLCARVKVHGRSFSFWILTPPSPNYPHLHEHLELSVLFTWPLLCARHNRTHSQGIC